jgi:hypothetical protein
VQGGVLKQGDVAVEYTMRRLRENLETMRMLCDKWCKEERVDNPSNDPVEGFDLLFNSRKTDPRHRMKGLYCYDVRESESFANTFKAEVRMHEIQAKI